MVIKPSHYKSGICSDVLHPTAWRAEDPCTVTHESSLQASFPALLPDEEGIRNIAFRHSVSLAPCLSGLPVTVMKYRGDILIKRNV